MNVKELFEAVKGRLQLGELAKEFADVDYFCVSSKINEPDPVYGVDEVRIAHGSSEGVYADFYGHVGDDDTTNIFTVKTLDGSESGFNALCKLSGEIIVLCERTLKEDKTRQVAKNLLSEAVDGIFLKLQERMGIQSGDISPEDSMTLDKNECDLLGTIMNVLSKQPRCQVGINTSTSSGS